MKRLCLTIGDTSGIGPEIVLKFLRQYRLHPETNLQIVGDIEHLSETASRLNIPFKVSGAQYDCHHIDDSDVGTASYRSLQYAVDEIAADRASGLVTGPIAKENFKRAGLPWSGQTEVLEYLAQQAYGGDYQADMLFVYRKLRLLLLTRHVPLSQVRQNLTTDGVFQSVENVIDFLKNVEQIDHPKIAMLAVNPHSIEIDGTEERTILQPTIEELVEKYHVQITQPQPADGFFRGFNPDQNSYDVIVASYHDQGLIPFKLIAGLRAVNVTIGLPFIRTSVSHGTANDIVGQGIADPASLIAAVEQAFSYTQTRIDPVAKAKV